MINLTANKEHTPLENKLRHPTLPSASKPDQDVMRIAVTGASGLVGSALSAHLKAAGHTVHPMVRNLARNKEIFWLPTTGSIDVDAMEGVDVVVHLAGENIAEGRWNDDKKARIRDSRVDGTRMLCEALADLDHPPKTLIAASAIGYYGSRGDKILDESSDAGEGFLSDVCRDWEEATSPARRAGIRVVHLRFGVILSPDGGALAKMLAPFKFGVGGKIGSGRQYWSWISIDDVIGAIQHAIRSDSLQGPVNVVAPHPVTNREFTKTLGKVLRRPTLVPMPSWLARLALGEMANDLLLASTRVEPKRLLETGYRFRHPNLEDSLRHLLNS